MRAPYCTQGLKHIVHFNSYAIPSTNYMNNTSRMFSRIVLSSRVVINSTEKSSRHLPVEVNARVSFFKPSNYGRRRACKGRRFWHDTSGYENNHSIARCFFEMRFYECQRMRAAHYNGMRNVTQNTNERSCFSHEHAREFLRTHATPRRHWDIERAGWIRWQSRLFFFRLSLWKRTYFTFSTVSRGGKKRKI